MGLKLGSRIYTESFATQNSSMTKHLEKRYFGFQNDVQYSYNLYHQLADNGSGAGARGARWARINNIPIAFIPPKN